jgi:hypothetical protein
MWPHWRQWRMRAVRLISRGSGLVMGACDLRNRRHSRQGRTTNDFRGRAAAAKGECGRTIINWRRRPRRRPPRPPSPESDPLAFGGGGPGAEAGQAGQLTSERLATTP